ncbi:unnamed protein product [Cochlearia groenlandica]
MSDIETMKRYVKDHVTVVKDYTELFEGKILSSGDMERVEAAAKLVHKGYRTLFTAGGSQNTPHGFEASNTYEVAKSNLKVQTRRVKEELTLLLTKVRDLQVAEDINKISVKIFEVSNSLQDFSGDQ